MSEFAILGSNNGGQCLTHGCGHPNGFIAKLAATLMDPNFNHGIEQAHAITSIAHKFGGQEAAHFTNGENVNPASTGKSSAGIQLS